MNEAEYLMKNYGDRGGCIYRGRRPRRITPFRDLHNSSYDANAQFNNCFIIHSKQFLV